VRSAISVGGETKMVYDGGPELLEALRGVDIS